MQQKGYALDFPPKLPLPAQLPSALLFFFITVFPGGLYTSIGPLHLMVWTHGSPSYEPNYHGTWKLEKGWAAGGK